MLSQEIRHRFLNYFKEKGHAIVPSSSVVPHEDPTLLFTNAGMNQFKDLFLGKSSRTYTRAATAQKCIRAGGKHNDLDNVGHTARHLTFFEMLGNFSFGDYFKKEAIQFAWEVTTRIFGFAPEKLWITVFREDEEAFELWKQIIPEKRIVWMDERDNFWSMGETGPCGPCSELYYDRGERYGPSLSFKQDVEGEGNRYLEFWNLVFMQFDRDAKGKMHPLPKQSIDTGAGLERILSLIMDVDSLFATDVLRALIAQVEEVSGKRYEKSSPLAPAFHVIADHIRSLSFAIADGVQPSNIERGYVLRKILRRAVRYGRNLGLQEPFLAEIFPRLAQAMGEDYPELIASQSRITEILNLEEEHFLRTLKKGGNILNSIIEDAQKSRLKEIRGEEAFKLKDTYGFPLEEILLIAKDASLSVNLEAYQILEEEAKEKSRAAATGQAIQESDEPLFKEYLKRQGAPVFVGYTHAEIEAKVTALIREGRFVDAMEEGEEGIVLLDKTPFYAEKGGQVGDMGTLFAPQGDLFTVLNCLSPYPGIIAHVGKVTRGTLKINETVTARIDRVRRGAVERNHTATHLLHFALQKVLGAHIKQAGSLVDPERLRFDFNHHKALSAEEVRQIEQLVNQKIRENRKVDTYELSLEEAHKRSEIKQFFGDKYGQKVRVVDIDYSKELCGGTHVPEVGVIGLFRIIKESSIAAGVRRIEAVTGSAAEDLMYSNEDQLQALASLLKVSPSKIGDKVSSLLEENRELSLKLKMFKRASLKQLAEELRAKILSIGSFHFLAAVANLEDEELLLLADEMMGRSTSLVLILATRQEGRCQLLVKVSPPLVEKGIQAVALVKEMAPFIEGSGGGKGEMARAGGKNPEGILHAFNAAEQFLKKQL
jgi:alanyl-tRNA synthetase